MSKPIETGSKAQAHRAARCDQRCGERGIYHDHAISIHCTCGRDYSSVQAFNAHVLQPIVNYVREVDRA